MDIPSSKPVQVKFPANYSRTIIDWNEKDFSLNANHILVRHATFSSACSEFASGSVANAKDCRGRYVSARNGENGRLAHKGLYALLSRKS
jgi:hypothetical protein